MEEVRGEAHNHMSTIYGVGCGDEEVEASQVAPLLAAPTRTLSRKD